MIVHIDADVLVYRAGFAAEHTFYTVTYPNHVDRRMYTREFESKKELNVWMEGLKTNEPDVHKEAYTGAYVKAEPEAHALFNARSMIRTIQEKMEADKTILYLSGPTNYRLGIATIKPYKGNRDPDHKPVHGPAIKAMLRREYDVVTSDGQEADDDMAIAHYGMWVQDPYSSVIATIDKDLDMVPGLHYNFAQEKQYYVEPFEGLRYFYQQLLKGDTVDNIPGVPGIGKVKAEKVLADCVTEWELYQTARTLYVQGYGDKADEALLENGRLLWMRREPNEWWSPPKEDTSANS